MKSLKAMVIGVFLFFALILGFQSYAIAAGITVDLVGGDLGVTEGGQGTFNVKLTDQPAGDVIVSLTSPAATIGTVTPATLTFTTTDWNTNQTVTVTAAEDDNAANETYDITLTAAGHTDGVVHVTNTDNDTAAIVTDLVGGNLGVTEGGQGTFNVKLTAQPAGDVIVSLTSPAATIGTVTPATLTFTTTDWNTNQTVTVTAAEDVNAANETYDITLTAAGHTDGVVHVTNTDNDAPGITTDLVGGNLGVTEGGQGTFNVKLTAQPAGDVIVSLTSPAATIGTVTPATLTFTTTDWNTNQTVTVTAAEDDNAANETYDITLTAAGHTDAVVHVTNTDNEAPSITVTPTTGLKTTEGGGKATFTVKLNTEPTTGFVAIQINSSNTNEGTVSPAKLVYPASAAEAEEGTAWVGNYNDPQTVTVTGVNDSNNDGDKSYKVTLSMDGSSESSGYKNVAAIEVSVTNTDNDEGDSGCFINTLLRNFK